MIRNTILFDKLGLSWVYCCCCCYSSRCCCCFYRWAILAILIDAKPCERAAAAATTDSVNTLSLSWVSCCCYSAVDATADLSKGLFSRSWLINVLLLLLMMMTMILSKVYYRDQVAALTRPCWCAALLLAECYSTITAVLFDAKPCERSAAIDSVERANLVIEKGYYCDLLCWCAKPWETADAVDDSVERDIITVSRAGWCAAKKLLLLRSSGKPE